MIRKKMNKSMVVVATMIMALSGVFVGGNYLLTRYAEAKIEQKSNQEENENVNQGTNAASEVGQKFAKEIKESMPDVPLLDEYATEHYGDSSLEAYVDDVNATKWAKNTILAICDEEKLDVKTATVKDLTVEQLARIDQETFEHSDHPIDPED